MRRSDSQARGAVLAASPPATDNPRLSKASHEFAGMPHDSGLRPPQNPILFVHRRGRDVEVCHRGAVAIQRGEELIFGAGDVSRAYFVRSAAKPFQTLPLLIDDGVQRFSLSQEEVAVTSSSHGGEPFHVRAVAVSAREGRLRAGAAPVRRPRASARAVRATPWCARTSAERAAQQTARASTRACCCRARSRVRARSLHRSRSSGAAPDPCGHTPRSRSRSGRSVDRGGRLQRTDVRVPLDGMARGFRNLANADR
jgi:hypothetical protein